MCFEHGRGNGWKDSRVLASSRLGPNFEAKSQYIPMRMQRPFGPRWRLIARPVL